MAVEYVPTGTWFCSDGSFFLPNDGFYARKIMPEMTDEEAAQLLSGSILSMSGTLDGKLRDAIIKALDALREKVGKKKEEPAFDLRFLEGDLRCGVALTPAKRVYLADIVERVRDLGNFGLPK